MSLPSRACKSRKLPNLLVSRAAKFGCFDIGAGCGIGSGIYLGEDGGPDGLDILDLGGTEDGLDLVGLNEDSRSVTNFAEWLLIPVASQLLIVFLLKLIPTQEIKLQFRSSSLH